ncbi:hypothetical protein [Chryseobacterium sp.]|uniref:hypothetical protein n=1 Tax=Chryseobacterium sp. TaxID=1871047 RepID=UPI0028517FD6|nr:hypothetical protein [Chryseobacterium sp.]MDR3023058.1 hypothetical protein [Chryseobacterium sp.]
MKNRKITSLAAVMLGLSITVSGQTGNVGINTTSPTKTLDINGDLRTRTLPVIPEGTPVVADADGNIGIFKPGNPNDFVLYNIDSNVRQNTSVSVPLTSILNTVQTNAQDGGGTTIQPANCWVIPNSEVIFKFPAGSTLRGTASWNTWFEMAYGGVSWSATSIIDGTGQIKVPLFFHNRTYARLYKKIGATWTPINVVTISMQTVQISPYLYESSAQDSSGNPHAVSASSNLNFRYSMSAFYSVGDGTSVPLEADTEYKVELLYGIENLSSRSNITDPTFLQNWGVQSTGYSFYKN